MQRESIISCFFRIMKETVSIIREKEYGYGCSKSSVVSGVPRAIASVSASANTKLGASANACGGLSTGMTVSLGLT